MEVILYEQDNRTKVIICDDCTHGNHEIVGHILCECSCHGNPVSVELSLATRAEEPNGRYPWER